MCVALGVECLGTSVWLVSTALLLCQQETMLGTCVPVGQKLMLSEDVEASHHWPTCPSGLHHCQMFMLELPVWERLPGAQAPPAPAVDARPQAADRVWVLCESCGDHKIGEQVSPPPVGVPMLNNFGLMHIDAEAGHGRVCLIKQVGVDEIATFCEERVQYAREGEAIDGEDRFVADDIRTMSVKFTANGERRRGFRETVDEFTVTEMENFPYEPRTCLPYLQAVQSVAESSYAQHLAWRQQSRIPEGSRAIYEDEALSHILDTAITFDCLCVPNLACFELLVRRKQLIAEAHAYSPASPNYEGADHWLGNQYRPWGSDRRSRFD